MTEYSLNLQKLYLEFILSDHDLFIRVNNIIDPAYFDQSLSKTVKFIREYADEYGKLPEPPQINSKTGVLLDSIGKESKEHRKWFLDDFESFCRHKGLEVAILKSADHIEKKNYGMVEKLIKEATEIGLAKDLGTDYWLDPEARIRRMMERNEKVSTGWKTVDDILYEGFDRGTLNIFAGGSGAGKSLFLQNLGLNWAALGYNVVYFSLELSETLCCLRFDAMLSGYSTREIFKNIDEVTLRISVEGKKAGSLQVVQLPSGITVNALKSFIKEYQIQHDIEVHGVLVDYLDLMAPAIRARISGDNLFVKDKYISEELRNFSIEGQYLFATASQLNRGAVDELEFDHSHIGGGLSKIQTADNVFGIFSGRSVRENGRVQIQFMKTRSSNGVGKKLSLAFDIDSMRITDLTEEEDTETEIGTKIYDNIVKNRGKDNPSQNTSSEEDVLSKTDRLKSLLTRSE